LHHHGVFSCHSRHRIDDEIGDDWMKRRKLPRGLGTAWGSFGGIN
jgi:hypothetical protein